MAKRPPSPLEELTGLPSPSQDHTGRCSGDQVLRSCGYKIHARPRQGEAIWTKRGVLFPASEALLRCQGLKGGL